MTQTLRIRPLLATAAALALAIPIASFASDSTTPAEPAATPAPAATAPAPTAPAAEAEATPTLEGVKVAVDPKTGELRKLTAAEDAELRTQMAAFWSKFANVPHTPKVDRKNNRTSLVIAPLQMRLAIATIGPDGKTVWDCAGAQTDPADFVQQLQAKAAAAPAAAQEEK